MQIDAPFIFRADDVAPSPLESAVHLHVAPSSPVEIAAVPPRPLAAGPKRKQETAVASVTPVPGKRRFFGKLRSFFAAMFR